MDRRQMAIVAGGKLRRMRQDRRLTQQDIEKKTAERFGDDARVYAQQVSRIETGSLDKPPILDLLRYGQILGLSPDDIGEMYGLWPRTQKTLDPRLKAAIDLSEELSGLEREQFLEWVQFAVLQARSVKREPTRAVRKEPARKS